MEKIKRAKGISIILLFVMVFQLMMPVNFAYAAAKDVGYRIDTPKTKVEVDIYDGEDKIAPEADGSYKNVPLNAEIELHGYFEFLNGTEDDDYDYNEGDYFILNFPPPIDFGVPIGGYEVKNDDGEVIAILTLDGDQAKITFTDKVDGKSNIKVKFKIKGTFKTEMIDGEDPVKIEVGYGGKVIEIGVIPPAPEPVDFELSKNGEFDLTNGEIKWTITVSPKDGKTANGVVLRDTNSSNHTFLPDTFAVTGTAITGSALTLTANGFEYAFGGPIEGAQTITYRTRIDDMTFKTETGTNSTNSEITYDNKVAVFMEGTKKKEVPASVKLNWINKSADKQLYDDGKKIKWKITINNKDGFLNGKNATIIDSIGAYHDFVINPLYPVQIKINSNSPADVSEDQYSISGKTLTYKIGSTSFETAELTYYTEINNPNANDNENYNYQNNAKLVWSGNSDGPSHQGSKGIGMGIIDKSVTGPDTYVNGMEIKWTVEINRNRVEISNAVFEDMIPEGLNYKSGSFKHNGTAVTPSAIGIGGKTKLTYTLGYINSPQTITYITTVDENYAGLFSNGDNNGNIKFTNSATLTGTGINGTPGDVVTKDVKSNVIDKSIVERYNYESRIVKWKIEVNKNQIPLSGLTVSDFIPKGMKFLPDSFKIDDGAPDVSKFTYSVNADDNITDKDRFQYIIGNTSSKHVITYETEVKEKYLADSDNLNKVLKFDNDAKVEAEGRNDVSVSVEEKVNNFIVTKTGKRTGFEFVLWSVPINTNKIKLNNVVLSDALQAGLALDMSSVELYNLNIDSEGNQVKGSKIDLDLNKDKYSFDYDEEQRIFTFEFKEEINEAYQLEFTTDITVNYIEIKNTIELKGYDRPITSTDESLKINVSSWSGSGSASNGSVIIEKVDEDGVLLTGAEFKFYDKNNNIYSGTESGGRTTYINLPFRWYYIQETKAPEGYLLDKTIHQVRLTSTEGITYPITNIKALADFEFVKQDEEGNNIDGAEFFLTKEGSVPIRAESVNGAVIFTGISEGTYTLTETKVGGYETLDPITVVVKRSSDQTKMEVTFDGVSYDPEDPPVVENKFEEIFGNIELIKEDGNDGRLAGAEFTLYNLYDDSFVESKLSVADGTIKFESVPLGEYYIIETNAPDGYMRSTEKIYASVTRDSGDPSKAKVLYYIGDSEPAPAIPVIENKSIDIALNKQDESGALPGVEFKLFKDGETDAFRTAISDAVGDVEFKTIPVGKYYIKETTPSTHKPLEKDIMVEVALNDNEELEIKFSYSDESKIETGENGELIVINEKQPTGGGGGTTPTPVYGSVAVKKVDEDRKVLSGAEFTLYDSNGKVVGKAVTGSDGTVSFEELEPGEYVLKETRAPEGYVLDDKETDVTISANRTSSYTFTNRKEEPKKPGRIEIIKTDEEGKLLSDAWFSLIDENGSTLQNAGTVNGRVAFEDVPVGRYTVKEVQAPEGYELSGKEVTVTVESNKTVELSFVNKKSGTPVVPANGRISISKVDENSNALAGAEFTLYDENNRIVETAVSDRNGNVVFENLKDGRYFVKETKAPEGYVLVNEAKIVDIAGGQTYSYRFKNVPESVLIEDPDVPMGWETIDEPDVPKGVGTLPNTGYILNTWMLAALGLLLIAEGLFLRKRRITN